jgi:hypothetical protein
MYSKFVGEDEMFLEMLDHIFSIFTDRFGGWVTLGSTIASVVPDGNVYAYVDVA